MVQRVLKEEIKPKFEDGKTKPLFDKILHDSTYKYEIENDEMKQIFNTEDQAPRADGQQGGTAPNSGAGGPDHPTAVTSSFWKPRRWMRFLNRGPNPLRIGPQKPYYRTTEYKEHALEKNMTRHGYHIAKNMKKQIRLMNVQNKKEILTFGKKLITEVARENKFFQSNMLKLKSSAIKPSERTRARIEWREGKELIVDPFRLKPRVFTDRNNLYSIRGVLLSGKKGSGLAVILSDPSSPFQLRTPLASGIGGIIAAPMLMTEEERLRRREIFNSFL